MQRNIKLIFLITILKASFFWLGVWIPYYLRFTNYAGVGIIETIGLATGFILEIPTGAIADILGKKNVIIFAFGFQVCGYLLMAYSQTFLNLVFAVLLMGISGALLSGTSDALLYDSLKEINKESQFDTIFAGMQKYGFLCMAAASIIGGFIYTKNPRFPFFIYAMLLFISFVLSFFLEEPQIKEKIYSAKDYLIYSIQGFKELFKNSKQAPWVLNLLLLGSIASLFLGIFDPILALNIGYTPEQLGVLFAILTLISALGTHLYPFFKKYISQHVLIIILIVIILFVSMISPLVGFLVGTMTIVSRNIIYPLVDVISSNAINQAVESTYRVTTLSTFAFLQKLPYVFLAYFVGYLTDAHNAKFSAFVLSTIFALFFIAMNIGYIMKERKQDSYPST